MFTEDNIITNDNYHNKECLCCDNIRVLPDGKWCEDCLDEINNVKFQDCLTREMIDDLLFGNVKTFNVEIDPIYARILERDSDVYYDGTPKPWIAQF